MKNKEMSKYKNKSLIHNSEKKDVISEKPKKNKKYTQKYIKTDNNDTILNSARKINNTKNKYSRNESQEIISSINQEYNINNDRNASMNNIYNVIDD